MTSHAAHLIDGHWIDGPEERVVLDPADGSAVGAVAYGGAAEAARAVQAATDAQDAWATSPARTRARMLHTAADLIDERADELGLVLAREGGKRLPEAIGEMHFSAEYFRWFAEEARRPEGALHPHESASRRHLTLRRPAGVVASLTPWNFPCSIQARKLAPALAAGCAVVARVSEKAPLAATAMIGCLVDAGVPDGVVNIVHGPASEVTEAYLAHPAVRVVTFTGSTEVGRLVMRLASQRIVRPLLELGGNAAFLVFDDAHMEEAVEGAMLAKFRNTGQSCIGANRFLVHQSVFDEFTERLAARIDAMTIGAGAVPDPPDLGPCIDSDRVHAVESMVNAALDKGATRVTADRATPGAGSFCQPTLLTGVRADGAMATEEIFGPAAAVFPFTEESEAMAMANATEMGLAGYVYTRDLARAWRVAETLDVGILGLNDPLPSVAFAPMGGTKQSGIGREGGASGIEEFQETRYLALTMARSGS